MSSKPAGVHPGEIVFENVGVHYRTQKHPSLENITFTVSPGEKAVIVGASGSGKSTLIHAVNSLARHRYEARITGSLRVGQTNPATAELTEVSRAVGTVLQNSDSQFVAPTVAEDIAFALENREVPTDEMEEKIHRAARRVHVEELLDASPHGLSGGQKQRVAIAGVLADDVPTLIFDEPLANLDPASGLGTVELIDELNRDCGTTVLIVEHRLEEVLHRGVDRIIVMDAGKIVANGTPARILSSRVPDEVGIRRPLYLTALQAAGISVGEERHPEDLSRIDLTDEEKQTMRNWVHASEQQKARGETPKISEIPETSPSSPTEPDAVSVSGAVVEYRDYGSERTVRALDGVDLRVRRGELLAVLGTNGAGKSTLAGAVCGFEKTVSGTIKIQGADISGMTLAQIGKRVAFVLQNPMNMISQPRVEDEVALGLRARAVPEDEVRSRVRKALQTCGIAPFAKWPVSALSHGQKKRVTIASALVLGADILILDEPTAGQDLRHYTEFMEFIRELNQSGTTVLLITHDMHLALEYAPRAIVLSRGKVIADAPPAQILTDPQICARGSLVPTSLHDLARMCGISPAAKLVDAVIENQRRARAEHGEVA